MRFQQALEGYWLARRRDFSPHTVSDYELTFARFQTFIGDKPVADITAADIHRFLNDMASRYRLSKKTLSNIWTALSSFWTWAEHALHVPHVIRGEVRRPVYRRPEIGIYTEVEIKAMLGTCARAGAWNSSKGQLVQARRPSALRDQAIIATLVDTGARASELCAFQIRDYHSKQNRLMVYGGKGNKDRVLFVGVSTQRFLWRYLAERPDAKPTDPLFATRNNTPLKRDVLLHLIRRIAENAGVTGATIHKFRHTFSINFLRNGGNVLELQRLLGHEKMDTITIYVRLAEVDLERAQRRASVADNWHL